MCRSNFSWQDTKCMFTVSIELVRPQVAQLGIYFKGIINYSRILGLCHPVNRMCRKLSVRIKMTRTVNESNPLHKFALGIDGVILRQQRRRRREEIGAIDCPSFLIRLFNSPMNNIDHLMFEYILNWPDQPSWLFLWLSLDLDEIGPFDDTYSSPWITICWVMKSLSKIR